VSRETRVEAVEAVATWVSYWRPEGSRLHRLRFRLDGEQALRMSIAVKAGQKSSIKERNCPDRGVENVRVALLFMRRQGRCYILVPSES